MNARLHDAGSSIPHSFTINLRCNPSLGQELFRPLAVDETSPCRYVVEGETGASCACQPNCQGKLCGPDGCGGSCSGAGFSLPGGCPSDYVNSRLVPQVCVGGDCCRPDCLNRDCGSDGCGGSCGTCDSDEMCLSLEQFCVSKSSQGTNDDAFDYYESQTIPVYAINSGGLAGKAQLLQR